MSILFDRELNKYETSLSAIICLESCVVNDEIKFRFKEFYDKNKNNHPAVNINKIYHKQMYKMKTTIKNIIDQSISLHTLDLSFTIKV